MREKIEGGSDMAYSDAMWAEAKKKCRLNNEDIALAKRLL